ncbi:CynX/NimT family MFS transporter [Entomospira culicis]|uniref:MFS transporter n=1 Tax=Entomospira culicis TaxID=2719989 RepID=A0A968GFZ5_9SPIO|nr:MFS transporter [Entomospira culicis]NIZ19652.1 MFS transporter [Entomospira culicis]NIZ69866.1 MFS transporter [Entomospira culicis]WDI36972.1 MFS transporter [Entomospira culicis]WDI38601.1 MFS transporter [Entomospira culicis]
MIKTHQPNKYMIEALLFLSYVLFGMSWQATALFLPDIREQMGVNSTAELSWITNVVSISRIIGTFLASTILIKLGTKKAVSLSMLLMSIGAFAGLVNSYFMLLLVRFIAGLGSSLIIAFFAPLVFELFEPKERPIVNGMNSVALNLGMAIIAFGLGAMMSLFNNNWQHVLLTISVGSLIIFILWLVYGTDTKPAVAKSTKSYTIIDGLKEPFNWLYALTYAGTLSFYLILLTFYSHANIPAVKYIFLMGIVGTIFGIIVAQKTYYRRPILQISGAVQILAIIGVHSQTWGWFDSQILVNISALMIGFFLFFPMTSLVLFAQERKGATAENLGPTFSLFWSISYLISAFAPYIFGMLVDNFNGNYSVAFVFSTIASSSFLIGAMIMKETKAPKNAS